MKASGCDGACHLPQRVLNAIERPELRHSLHYHCGIYKSAADRSPGAALHIDNEWNVPLMHAVIIVAASVALISLASTAARALSRAFPCSKDEPRNACKHGDRC